jgi:hypothetical protein
MATSSPWNKTRGKLVGERKKWLTTKEVDDLTQAFCLTFGSGMDE